jgi:prolyl-tRNA synthetase
MRQSKLISKKHKEKPSEAQLISHIYLLRGGYVRPVANGIYSLLPPAVRIQEKIEKIIREEMNKIDGQEVKMPVVLPRELWDESGRWDAVESELLRFRDRTGHDMLLAMTHEEGVTALARTEVSSYKEYPFMLYQIQTKFRDEARSRGGLIRVREFTMKDAYSFHTSQEDLDEYYEKCAIAYDNIFRRCGVPEVVSIQSDSGMMGGKVAHEYQLLTDSGEDRVIVCDSCHTYANDEVAVADYTVPAEELKSLEEFETPNTKTIEDLAALTGMPESKMAKIVFYTTEKGQTVAIMIRGDLEVNECKLAKVLKCLFNFATDDEVYAVGAVPGFASGMNLTCPVYVDKSVALGYNLICGANKEGYHLKNFNLSRDIPKAEIVDIATVRDGDVCPKCGQKLRLSRGIEVGNIFKLGTKYTESMKMTYTDENGQEQTPIMGCYGIGVGRLLASVIEVRHDDYGPIWPLPIAPWQVQLNVMGGANPEIQKTADEIYQQLENAGIEVLYDDRGLSAGIQFAEADLMGIPFRIIVAPRSFAEGKVEFKRRGVKEGVFVDISNITSFIQKEIQQEMEKYQ